MRNPLALRSKVELLQAELVAANEVRNKWFRRANDQTARADRMAATIEQLLGVSEADPMRFAQMVAQWDDTAQAKFFDELAEAPVKLGWTSFGGAAAFDGEGQWYHVAQRLGDAAKKMFYDFNYFIEHRDGS